MPNKSNYVYKLFNHQNEIIYIGKTTNLEQRMSAHLKTNSNLSNELYLIKYLEVSTAQDMDFLEYYLINKESPKLNKNANNQRFKEISFELNIPLKWEMFDHRDLVLRLMENAIHMDFNRFYCEKTERIYTLEKEKLHRDDKGTTFLIKGDKGYISKVNKKRGLYELTMDKTNALCFKRFDSTVELLSELGADYYMEYYLDGLLQEKIRFPKQYFIDQEMLIGSEKI